MCERRFHPDRSDNFCTVNTELRVNTELLVSLGGVLSSAGQTGRHVLAALETRVQTLTPKQVNSSLQGPNAKLSKSALVVIFTVSIPNQTLCNHYHHLHD